MTALKAGDRVQMPAWSDEWMQGDRYGVVRHVGAKYVQVQLDKSGRNIEALPEWLTPVTP